MVFMVFECPEIDGMVMRWPCIFQVSTGFLVELGAFVLKVVETSHSNTGRIYELELPALLPFQSSYMFSKNFPYVELDRGLISCPVPRIFFIARTCNWP